MKKKQYLEVCADLNIKNIKTNLSKVKILYPQEFQNNPFPRIKCIQPSVHHALPVFPNNVIACGLIESHLKMRSRYRIKPQLDRRPGHSR